MESKMTKYEIDVNGSLFEWDLEQGSVHFENDEVLMLWLNTTFKTFLDAIDEISGEKAAKLVMEIAGYRTGRIVSSFNLEKIGETDKILEELPNIYLTAGWGIVDIVSFSSENHTAVARFRNTWEYKVKLSQNKREDGTFIPGHFAGVFSGLFGANVWYRLKKSQAFGDEYTEYEFYPSDITPTLNVKAMIKEQAEEAQRELEVNIAQHTKVLSDLIKEISSPIIPVIDSILVIPLIGTYDETRAEELINRTLINLPKYKAAYLILDLTGIKNVDGYTLDFLRKFVQAARLLGTVCLFVGISPEMSIQITGNGYDLTGIPCFSQLQQGITYALDQMGLHITKKG
jgi:anti-anti-sigma regulatory factor